MNWNPDIGIPLAIAGVLLLIAIALFGKPRKPEQGRRRDSRTDPPGRQRQERQEPSLYDDDDRAEAEPPIGDMEFFGRAHDDALHTDQLQAELELIDRTLAEVESEATPETRFEPRFEARREPRFDTPTPARAQTDAPAAESSLGSSAAQGGESDLKVPPESQLGKRSSTTPQQIVTVLVSAREGQSIDGASIVVAAEKVGLTYGHMGIFHRLMDGRPEGDPVFSVANLVAPGHFDLRHVTEIETPGLTFFMTLPGPMSALDAWEAMLPIAQRMAELLDAVVLDEQGNALGRQRIANIRDELRNFDREQEREAQRPW